MLSRTCSSYARAASRRIEKSSSGVQLVELTRSAPRSLRMDMVPFVSIVNGVAALRARVRWRPADRWAYDDADQCTRTKCAIVPCQPIVWVHGCLQHIRHAHHERVRLCHRRGSKAGRGPGWLVQKAIPTTTTCIPVVKDSGLDTPAMLQLGLHRLGDAQMGVCTSPPCLFELPCEQDQWVPAAHL